ncbi:MAG: zinc ribbon domain-containing protein [Promethearchaeota archaeon]|nr:MAG: zinc ribbon domain-containing protein [Candidatus Lokiarchaeota archaeon]
MIKPVVRYENRFKINRKKAFSLSKQWLESQRKAKIKRITENSFIKAKQGTMMANTGHDPNWKKQISISFYQLEQNETLVRIEAMPIARTIFNIDKLKRSWYNGLFSGLFTILQEAHKSEPNAISSESEAGTQLETKFCSNCGSKVDKNAVICPRCGVDIV